MRQQQIAAERRFYSVAAIAILIAVFIGFSRSFYLKPVLFHDYPAPPEPIFILHGLIFSAWVLLFMLQTRFVAQGNVQRHRQMGSWGAVLAVAMVVMGAVAGLVAARRPGGFVGIPIPPLSFLIVPLTAIVLFAGFVTAAILQRRNPQAHKRLMLIGSLQMVVPAVARWPGIAPFGPPAFFGISDLLLIALAIFDFRTRGKLHPVTLWGGIVTIVSQPLQLVLSGTDAWLGFARWATGLLG